MAFQRFKAVVDLGSRHLKAVRAKQVAKSKFQVEQYTIVDAPSDPVFTPEVFGGVEVPSTFARSCQELVKKAKLGRTNVALLFPDFGFTVNMVTVPVKATDEEKAELINQEVVTLLPSDANVSEWIIERKEIGTLHANQLLFLAAIRRSDVLEVGTQVQKVGTNPLMVDLALLNGINVFHDYLTSAENLEKNVAIINFGHTASAIAIYKQGKLTTFHTRVIGTGQDQSVLVGGRAFTRRIMEHFKLSEDEAEEYKKNEVFFLPEFVPEQDKIANYQVIKPVFGELVKGLFTITEHYVARFREFKVDEVILTGGGANFSNIDVVLGGHLNTQVKPGADLVSIVDASGNELSAAEKNILTPAIGAFSRG